MARSLLSYHTLANGSLGDNRVFTFAFNHWSLLTSVTRWAQLFLPHLASYK